MMTSEWVTADIYTLLERESNSSTSLQNLRILIIKLVYVPVRILISHVSVFTPLRSAVLMIRNSQNISSQSSAISRYSEFITCKIPQLFRRHRLTFLKD